MDIFHASPPLFYADIIQFLVDGKILENTGASIGAGDTDHTFYGTAFHSFYGNAFKAAFHLVKIRTPWDQVSLLSSITTGTAAGPLKYSVPSFFSCKGKKYSLFFHQRRF